MVTRSLHGLSLFRRSCRTGGTGGTAEENGCPEFSGLRRRGVRLAVAGVVSATVAVGGVTVAGAVSGPTAAPAPARAGAVAAAQVAAGTTTLQLRSNQHELHFDIKKTERYPQTVFSEVTNEGKFNEIFPISGAKTNLGGVGTKHNLHKGPIPFPVTVSRLTSISWIFTTRPGHPDHKGTIEFLLSSGQGGMMRLIVVGTCAVCGTAAYKAVAKKTWAPFATNIRTKVSLP